MGGSETFWMKISQAKPWFLYYFGSLQYILKEQGVWPVVASQQNFKLKLREIRLRSINWFRQRPCYARPAATPTP
jgi:hypothetical protein